MWLDGSKEKVPDGYANQVKLANGQTVTADDDYLRESILRPAAKVVVGYQPLMPSFDGQVDEEQLIQLIAYIKSLAKPDAGVRSQRRSRHHDAPLPNHSLDRRRRIAIGRRDRTISTPATRSARGF